MTCLSLSFISMTALPSREAVLGVSAAQTLMHFFDDDVLDDPQKAVFCS